MVRKSVESGCRDVRTMKGRDSLDRTHGKVHGYHWGQEPGKDAHHLFARCQLTVAGCEPEK